MKNIIVILLLFITISCKESDSKDVSPNFESFIYANASIHSNSVIKFSGNDTIFFQKRFPENEGTYYSLLNKDSKDYLINFLNNLTLEKYKSHYTKKVIDGHSEIFVVNRNEKRLGIYIHGESGPKKLEELAEWLNNLKSTQKFIKTDKKIDFGDFEKFVFPPTPMPKIGI